MRRATVYTLFWGALLAACASAADDACAGCALAGAVTCGSDGITYASPCLAACAGATKLHDGPCGPATTLAAPPLPGAQAAAAAQAAGSGGVAGAGIALHDHPIGRFLKQQAAGADAGPAGAAGSPLSATSQDVARFKAEGMVLVGAAQLAESSPGGKPPAGAGDGGYPDLSSPAARRAALEVYRVRVLPAQGLVYASAAPLRTSVRDLVAAAPAAAVAVAPPAAPIDGSTAAAQQAPSPAQGASASPGDVPLTGWERVTRVSGLPLTAIGWLSATLTPGWRVECTGTLFARHAFVTAASCLYVKRASTFSGGAFSSGSFAPHVYCSAPPNKTCTIVEMMRPFGDSKVYSYEFLTGWLWSKKPAGKRPPKPVAWQSNIAVATLEKPLGSLTGTMGFGYQPIKGVSPLRVYAAGYPQFPGLHTLAGACYVRDRPASDDLELRMFPPVNTCLSACAIADRGQSGQPAYLDRGPGNFEIRAVLDRGPSLNTCKGADTYAKIDKLHFDMMSEFQSWAPPSA